MAKKEYSFKCKGCGGTHCLQIVDGEVVRRFKPKADDDKPKKDDVDKKKSKHDVDDDESTPFEDFLLGRGKFAGDDEDQDGEDTDKDDDE